LLSEAGVRLATAKVTLPILGMTQLSRVVGVLGVAPPLAGARIVLSTSTPGGAFAASASLIDNGTNHPRTLLPSYPPSSTSRPMWLLPSSARVAGAQGAYWTTDLTLANVGSQDAEIRLKFLSHDTDGRNGVEKSVRLAAGLSVTYTDVLGSLFGLTSGYGAILVTATTSGLALLSQTSTPGNPSGTYGQTVPGAAERDWIEPGQVRTIAGVFEDLARRTNLILANATDAPCEVDVVLVSESGTIRASKRYALPPLGMTQVNRVVIDMGLSGELDEAIRYGQLLLSTSTPGGAFAAYAAVIDAYVNDPQTVQPR